MSVEDVDEATGEERRRTLFREAAMFDISQTEPPGGGGGREAVALSPPGGRGIADRVGAPSLS